MKDDIRFVIQPARISIQVWMVGSYDYGEGYHEIAYIKLSKSKASFMDDINLEEIKGIFNNLMNKRG